MEKIYLLINKSVIDNGNPHIMVTPFKSFDDAKNKLIDDVKGQEYIESGSDLYKEQIFDTFNIPEFSFEKILYGIRVFSKPKTSIWFDNAICERFIIESNIY